MEFKKKGIHRRSIRGESGSILIFALWSLGLLAIFAAYIAVGVRQKINFLKHVEYRSKVSALASSGVSKAIAMLIHELKKSESLYTPEVKMALRNNEREFADIALNNGTVEISYVDGPAELLKRYGMTDEEGKINLNKVDVDTLERLIQETTSLSDVDARELAESIIDWRQPHESEPEGFFSGDYYSNLQYPYPAKDKDFEVVDELSLVKGMTPLLFQQLLDYVTVYGEGKVNVNTAQKSVLISLGLDELLANKILLLRRGADGEEATGDDYIFRRPDDLAGELSGSIGLEDSEREQLKQLSAQNKLIIDSRFYRIESMAALREARQRGSVICVFNSATHRIEYWREELKAF